MRSIRGIKATLAGLAITMAAAPAALALDCTDLNGRNTTIVGTSGFDLVVSFNLKAGDVITIRNTLQVGGGASATLAVPFNLLISVNQTASGTVATTATTNIVGTSTGTGTSKLDFTCVSAAAGASGSTSAPINQSINNAQVGIQNGQQTLQSYNDWLSKTVSRSFSRGKGGSTAARRPNVLSAQVELKRLEVQEAELAEELVELRAARVGSLSSNALTTDEVSRRLATVRRELVFARSNLRLTSDPTERGAARQSSTAQQATDAYEGGARRTVVAAAPAMSFATSDLIDLCDTAEGVNAADELFGRKWNVWLEARIMSAVDSLAQNNTFGFNGSGGVDYKVQPWLAVGLSIGTETYETKFGTLGVRSGTVGVSVMPYVGIRLTDNVFASAFTGLTRINYNSNPAANISSQFEALRFMLGGALTGIWREEQWRFQPTLAGTFGSETQNAYVDSAGNNVNAQTLSYGRISAGPEVGYTFDGADQAWTIEPFVLARFNVDFASSNLTTVNGLSVILRPGTLASGSSGVGAELRLQKGFYVRAQGTYDSIGVTGLDVWSGLLRGGMAF